MSFSTINLTGKKTNIYSPIHLSGNNLTNFNQNIPLEVKKLKTMIMSHIFLPLISKQWAILRQNVFFLNIMKNKIKYYQSFVKDDLQLYADLLNMFEIILNEHTQFEEMERKVYSGINGKNDVSSLIYKTTIIRLKPEYEIYNIIFGKPQREKKQVYHEEVIKDIQKILEFENITFDKIQELILDKYGKDI